MPTGFANKRVILGVTGGIAAYKAAELVRRLVEQGAQVQVVMTVAATRFVTALTFQALSGRPVREDLMDLKAEAAMGHIELARWADLVLVAPASADFLARLANGQADDLLTALCLASLAPVVVAPAMNRVMWENHMTRANCDKLEAAKVRILGPASGSQACGERGPGRMLEPLELLERAGQCFSLGSLAGVRVLCSAGPTREAIDPVRFISNRSSGKMGFAMAAAAVDAGALTTLVSGPVTLDAPERLIERVDVESAGQMHEEVMKRVGETDLFISVAAVADYRPRESAAKIKKSLQGEQWQLSLQRGPDILGSVANLPNPPFLVGFAAETGNLLDEARLKLQEKGLQLLVANQVGSAGAGFDSDCNAAHLLWASGEMSFELMPKPRLAQLLVAEIARHYHALGRDRRAVS